MIGQGVVRDAAPSGLVARDVRWLHPFLCSISAFLPFSFFLLLLLFELCLEAQEPLSVLSSNVEPLVG